MKYIIVFPMRENSTRLKNKMLLNLTSSNNCLASIAFNKINTINNLYANSDNIKEVLEAEKRELVGAYALLQPEDTNLIEIADEMKAKYLIRPSASNSVKDIYTPATKYADVVVRASACNPFLACETIIASIIAHDEFYDSTIFTEEKRDWFWNTASHKCYTNPGFNGTQHSIPIYKHYHGIYVFDKKNVEEDKFFGNKINTVPLENILCLKDNAKYYDFKHTRNNLEHPVDFFNYLETIDIDEEKDFITALCLYGGLRDDEELEEKLNQQIDGILDDIIDNTLGEKKETFTKTNEYKAIKNLPKNDEWFEKRGFRTTLDKEGRFYKQMIIDTSWDCNLSCRGCNRACDLLKKKTYISLNAIDTLVNDCLDNAIALERIYIEGGEPMLHPNIEDIVSKLVVLNEKFGTKLYLITNGLLSYKHLKKYQLIVLDSKKNNESKYIEKFEFFMNAPCDTGVPEALYERGCTFPYRSGPCLAPNGKIYSCPCAARIVDLFGIKYRGYRKLSRVKLDEFEKQYKNVCKYCGRLKPITGEDIPSPSWRKILKEYKNG